MLSIKEKQIDEFPKYMVRSDGKIYSKRNKRFLKPEISNAGYCRVLLYDEQGKKHHASVHRVVATAFVPNPELKPQVLFKNGDKLDCRACNLQWADAKEATNHGDGIERRALKQRDTMPTKKAVNQYDENHVLIKSYQSLNEAARSTGLFATKISEACKRKWRCGGFFWEFVEET